MVFLGMESIWPQRRLGAQQRYNSRILVSDATYEQPFVQKRFVLRPLDQVAVKGKAQGTRIYEVMGRKFDANDAERAIAEAQAEGFDLYLKRKFEAAAAAFKKTAEIFEKERGYADKAALLLEARCLDYAGPNPPPSDWCGTEMLKQKHF